MSQKKRILLKNLKNIIMASLDNYQTITNHYHVEPRPFLDNNKSVTVNRKSVTVNAKSVTITNKSVTVTKKLVTVTKMIRT